MRTLKWNRILSVVATAALLSLFAGCTEIGANLSAGRIGQDCERTSQCGYAEFCIQNVCAPTYCARDAECGAPDKLQCCGHACISADDSCSSGCISDADCGAGGSCLLGQCIKPCASDEDCPDNQFCLPGISVCIPNIQPPDGDTDMSFDGDFELPFEIPGDFEFETQECQDTTDCDFGECVGGFCLDLGGPGGKRCESNGDCAPGLYCLGGVCAGRPDGGCETSEDCGGGICIPGIGVCIGGDTGEGSRCETSQDCKPNEECIWGTCIGSSAGDRDRMQEEPDEPSGPGGPCQETSDCIEGNECIFYICVPTQG